MSNPTESMLTREDFLAYLDECLIPDLLESGLEATAEDFRTACQFIRDPNVAAIMQPL